MGDPAPPQLLDVIRCNCKAQQRYSTEGCSCHKERLSCTSYCSCFGGIESTKLTLETVDEDSNVDTNLEDTDDLDNDSDDIENGDAEDDWV